MWVDSWPHLTGHGYEISSIHICINVGSNIYTRFMHCVNTTKWVIQSLISSTLKFSVYVFDDVL